MKKEDVTKHLVNHAEWIDSAGRFGVQLIWLNANLTGADLTGADLTGADLTGADLTDASLTGANLTGANLTGADLTDASLTGANLTDADLTGADLTGADLTDASLTGANLTDADLICAEVRGADLSRAKGFPSPSEWMASTFDHDGDGYIVYKSSGNTPFRTPNHWIITEGAYLTEHCNPNRGTYNGCGVHFATEEWCTDKYPYHDLWVCRIEWKDLPGVVVPFGTNGKARCERLRLVRMVCVCPARRTEGIL
jgi:uncharacterized protein YjbI with pentapeptide repeats